MQCERCFKTSTFQSKLINDKFSLPFFVVVVAVVVVVDIINRNKLFLLGVRYWFLYVLLYYIFCLFSLLLTEFISFFLTTFRRRKCQLAHLQVSLWWVNESKWWFCCSLLPRIAHFMCDTYTDDPMYVVHTHSHAVIKIKRCEAIHLTHPLMCTMLMKNFYSSPTHTS